MRDIRERPELCPAIGGIEKIHGDVSVVARNPRLAPRHRNNIPATLFQQVRQHIAAGQAGGTRDKCSTLHLGHLSYLLYIVPGMRGGKFTSTVSVSVSAGQTCPRPPSTNSSMPVTKLESSEARNTAALATSSGSPTRPIGMEARILAMASGGCRSTRGVLIGPGLRTFDRMRRSFSSMVQARTRLRTAALVAP